MVIVALRTYDSSKCTDGVYLHGMLADMNMFDLVYIAEGDMPEVAGEYPCEVDMHGYDELIPAMFFYWQANGRNRGLICKLDDYDNMVEAAKAYRSRTPFL